MASIQIEKVEAKKVITMTVFKIFGSLKGLFLNCGIKSCFEKLIKFIFNIKSLNIGMTLSITSFSISYEC